MRRRCLLLLSVGLCLGACWAEPLPYSGHGSSSLSSSESSRRPPAPPRPRVHTSLSTSGHQAHGHHRSLSGSPRSPLPSAGSPRSSISSAGSPRSSISSAGSPRSPLSSSGYSSSHGSRSPSASSPLAAFLGQQPAKHAASATTSKPPSPARSPPPCDCDCYKRPTELLCAMDPRTREKETFLNTCQVACYNCTMKKRYKVVAHVPCEQYKD